MSHVRPPRRGFAAAALLSLCVTPLAAAPVVADPPLVNGKYGIVVFQETDAPQNWTVPQGVTAVTVLMQGAQGGQDNGGNGDPGGLAGGSVATVPVTPGQVLQINVGGVGGDASFMTGGEGGWNGGGAGGQNPNDPWAGGGGGGASDVRVAPYTLSNRVVTAGGGGGSAPGVPTGTGCPNQPTGYTGGPGGGTQGGVSPNGPSGLGGQQNAPGAGGGGGGGGTSGSDGVFGVGGNGSDAIVNSAADDSGGGGGGGWYGGGGGGSGQCYATAGGGGSGNVPAGGSTQVGTGTGPGWVEIQYQLPGTGTPPTLTLGQPTPATATSRYGNAVSFTATAVDSNGNTIPVACTPASGSVFPIGTSIVGCQATDSNGNTSSGGFTVQVNPAPLTVQAPSLSYVYGENVPGSFPATYSGLYRAEAQPVNPALCTSPAHSGSDVGTYPVTCTGADDSAYAVTFQSGTLTITKASTMLTASTLVTTQLRPTAKLTRLDNGGPIAGQTVAFTASGAAKPVCTATTGQDGVATCANTILTKPFAASFAGSTDYLGSSANGTLH